MIDVLSALVHLHQNRIIHRDLAARKHVCCVLCSSFRFWWSGNVLLSEEPYASKKVFQVCDYGLARWLDNDMTYSVSKRLPLPDFQNVSHLCM